MLEIKSLAVSAGSFQLRDIHLAVPEGACHAVLGPSGAGKSTLLQAVLGVRAVDSGSIHLAGEDITSRPVERRGLGYVPQRIGLFPHLTVRGNLTYSARARGLSPAQYEPQIKHLVEAAGIGALLDRLPQTLSGGEHQRVSLVRALAGQPRALLLDEPFTSLNESLRRELWWLLREWQREWHLTILLVTHDLAEAYFLADQVSILMAGRLLQQGDKAEVYGRPVAPAIAHFLGIETLHPGRIIARREDLVTVEIGKTPLTALAPEPAVEHVLVSIRGEDVMLERAGQAAASARTRLAARVLSIQPGRPMVRVELDAGFPLTALITQPACDELALAPGCPVTAVIKAPAVHLIPLAAERK